eukprot:XP_001709983.1 Hypothetical protein GL50803_112359 [Giardia lamblia ATCC 50803]
MLTLIANSVQFFPTKHAIFKRHIKGVSRASIFQKDKAVAAQGGANKLVIVGVYMPYSSLEQPGK